MNASINYVETVAKMRCPFDVIQPPCLSKRLERNMQEIGIPLLEFVKVKCHTVIPVSAPQLMASLCSLGHC